MVELGDDDVLAPLAGEVITSRLRPGVTYLLQRKLGEGGMGVAFSALRRAPDGISIVVLKLLRPSVARRGESGTLSVRKEAVALGRLNERVPPTPFVVRLLDNDSLEASYRGARIEIPWLAIEYVHGGVEGTSLDQRIRYSVEKSGYAFDPDRAALAFDCIGRGLAAVHEVGVVHRDVTPRNILCCGFGADEIFKVADFGIARPAGMAATFGQGVVGSLGFAAPEQLSNEATGIGTWSDVFGFGAVVFAILTGEDLFTSKTTMALLTEPLRPARRSITEAKSLAPEIRANAGLCRALDDAIARATAPLGRDRPSSVLEAAGSMTRLLRPDSRRHRPAERRLRSISPGDAPTLFAGWSWTPCHKPSGERVVRSAAWDGDAHCLVATTVGLEFWNGTDWRDVPKGSVPDPTALAFVRRTAPGRWLIGGAGGLLATFDATGIVQGIAPPDPSIRFEHAEGDVDDIVLAVGTRPGERPMLHTFAAGRWWKPLPVPDATVVTALARLDDARWLLAGRTTDGVGLAAVCAPTEWAVWPIPTPRTRAFLSCTACPDRSLGLVAGTDGSAILVDERRVRAEVVPGAPDISAAAVDVTGRHWVGGAAKLWVRQPGADGPWSCAWQDPEWTTPITSVFADVGMVVAMTADGGIVEGRLIATSAGAPSPTYDSWQPTTGSHAGGRR